MTSSSHDIYFHTRSRNQTKLKTVESALIHLLATSGPSGTFSTQVQSVDAFQ